ncbi:ECF transporter S component [Pseudoscardovia radai]|uniref:ECF transporter S component n=1 Tax=Pseudoscardovia radai TaxID=987066 RepID=UPI003993AFCB
MGVSQHTQNPTDQSNSANSASVTSTAKTANPGKTTDTARVTPHSHSTTGSGTWSTRRIAVYALFVAVALALSFISVPLMPAAPFLQYDPSGIVALIAGFAFGPSAAAIVTVLTWLPHLFTNPFGAIMAILVTGGASIPAAIVYKRRRTFTGAVIGLLLGDVIAIALAIVGNLIITPLYSPGITVTDVIGMIVPFLLPFNLLKMAINTIVTIAAYKPCSLLLKRTDA